MLTQGNHKLGGRLIWSFSLPSADATICTGMSGLNSAAGILGFVGII